MSEPSKDLHPTVMAGDGPQTAPGPTVPSPPAHRLEKAHLKKRFRLDEFLAEKLITSVAFVSLAAIVLIFVFVFREALPIVLGSSGSDVPKQSQVSPTPDESETYGEQFLGTDLQNRDQNPDAPSVVQGGGSGSVDWGNILGTTWQPVSSSPKFGILPLLVGSLKVTAVAILVGAPLAILAALFTSAFAPRWAKEIIKPSIEILAGFPSVVIGFFALVSLASMLQQAFGLTYRLNALLGGLAMSLAVIPIVYTVAEDALAAIPKYLKEASLALGATKWQTAVFVTLPAATPGVFAAVLLGFGRAFGETMIVLMATGNAALLSAQIAEPVRTISATIGAEMAEVVFGETHYHILFFLGALLFVFTFTLNAVAEIYVRNRLIKKFQGG